MFLTILDKIIQNPIPSLFLVILIVLDIAMVIDLIKSLINKDEGPYIEKEAKIY